MRNYILKGKTPVLCDDIMEWAKAFERTSERIVKQTDLPNDVRVSTVFLGLDHSFGTGEPLLFETMIFGGEHNDYTERCSTWEQAEAQHERCIEMVFA